MRRRKFLTTLFGMVGALIGLRISVRAFESRYYFIVDSNKCIGCGRCVVACKVENDVPKQFFRTWVERYTLVQKNGGVEVKVDSPEGGFYGFPELRIEGKLVRSYFVPKLCNQCEKPPCVQVCPVGATYKTPDGVILVDEKYCIGCRYCIQACPYGARYLYPSDGKIVSRRNTADKCNFCYHRIKNKLNPACVEVCPTNARRIFDVADERDRNRLLKTIKGGFNVLKPEQGTEPKVLYLGIGSEVK